MSRIKKLIEKLNSYGKEGWELVQQLENGILLLKREIKEEKQILHD